MKGLVTFAIIAGVLVLAGYAGMGYLLGSDSRYIAFACGNHADGAVEVQIAVPIALVQVDPPRTKMVGDMAVELWDEWIAEHFVIRAGADAPVLLERRHAANLIPDSKVGTPDSYLVGQLEVGKEYTFDYTPNVKERKKYRHKFTTTQSGPAFGRQIFDPVD